MRRVETRFERRKLWEEVWSEPLRTVGSKADIHLMSGHTFLTSFMQSLRACLMSAGTVLTPC